MFSLVLACTFQPQSQPLVSLFSGIGLSRPPDLSACSSRHPNTLVVTGDLPPRGLIVSEEDVLLEVQLIVLTSLHCPNRLPRDRDCIGHIKGTNSSPPPPSNYLILFLLNKGSINRDLREDQLPTYSTITRFSCLSYASLHRNGTGSYLVHEWSIHGPSAYRRWAYDAR
jgi:hypothetical protein